MKLHIENFAKISTADILFDGLTVIAGDNNTGKSTVGKILYSFFRGQSDIKRRVREERQRAIQEAFRLFFPEGITASKCDEILNGEKDVASMLSELLSKQNVAEDMLESSSGAIPLAVDANAFVREFGAKLAKRVDDVRKMPFEQVSGDIFKRVLNCVFHGQFHPLKSEEQPAVIEFDISGTANRITLFHDHAILVRPTRLFAKARLVTTPDVLSLLNIRDLEHNPKYANAVGKETYELAVELVRERRPETVISESRRKDLINSILGELSSISAESALVKDERGDYVLYEGENDIPTKAENLSMGMKSLVLLRLMLERQVLADGDVLILDEPENHLHPAWQVVYAHMLVLLREAFNLKILVTSHSQFFVNALQRFAISEGITDKTHFYVSRKDKKRLGYYTFDDKGPLASSIMASFNRAYDNISNMSGEFDDAKEEVQRQ